MIRKQAIESNSDIDLTSIKLVRFEIAPNSKMMRDGSFWILGFLNLLEW